MCRENEPVTGLLPRKKIFFFLPNVEGEIGPVQFLPSPAMFGMTSYRSVYHVTFIVNVVPLAAAARRSDIPPLTADSFGPDYIQESRWDDLTFSISYLTVDLPYLSQLLRAALQPDSIPRKAGRYGFNTEGVRPGRI